MAGKVNGLSFFRVFEFPLFYFVKTLFELVFHAVFRREIVFRSEQGVGETLHIGEFVFGVVRVLIDLGVIELFH